jgi:pyridoxal phosphate enzyme (YggS family)
MIADNFSKVKQRLNKSDATLIAVSKTRSATELQTVIDLGQRHFGENYLQEALEKINKLNNPDLIWHFIGPIQSNKTKQIAQNFDWVHSVDRLKIAKRLNEQRPKTHKKLNILLQINIDNSLSKSGVLVSEIQDLVMQIQSLENLKLRGFMCIPNQDFTEQSFQKMAEIIQHYPKLNILSMGMSADLELAIKYGASFVRIGTDIFGKRN